MRPWPDLRYSSGSFHNAALTAQVIARLRAGAKPARRGQTALPRHPRGHRGPRPPRQGVSGRGRRPTGWSAGSPIIASGGAAGRVVDRRLWNTGRCVVVHGSSERRQRDAERSSALVGQGRSYVRVAARAAPHSGGGRAFHGVTVRCDLVNYVVSVFRTSLAMMAVCVGFGPVRRLLQGLWELCRQSGSPFSVRSAVPLLHSDHHPQLIGHTPRLIGSSIRRLVRGRRGRPHNASPATAPSAPTRPTVHADRVSRKLKLRASTSICRLASRLAAAFVRDVKFNVNVTVSTVSVGVPGPLRS
jgi:hypothetical protein